MESDVYKQLAERMNQYTSKMPLVDSTFRLLKELYNEEEAGLAAHLPEGPHTARELSRLLGREESELAQFLEAMANKGLLFSNKTPEGKYTYEMIPWVPGIIELAILDRKDTPEVLKIHEMELNIIKEGMALLAPLMEIPEDLREHLPRPQLRTITINEALPKASR